MKGTIKFLGSVTLGERGQIVIPIEARGLLDTEPGDKLLVFKAPIEGAIVIAKPEAFERHIQSMNQRIAETQKEVENGK
ncbi:MAG TPA: AbrB/MazE/SpoVT family DNA-binding domain-containing protein [Candidatus Saccharimonadales bacterium]|jgi:AbrB family looped-hinge helix DNA binding protein